MILIPRLAMTRIFKTNTVLKPTLYVLKSILYFPGK